VTATGGAYGGAGIGGGEGGNGGNVTISGGTVVATGNMSGSGIGSGAYARGTGGIVTITGGTVVAQGADGGAGIGGCDQGNNGDAGTVTISGGTVTALGGMHGGAGIGGSRSGAGGTVTISGGTVTATGGESAGAGIGGGGDGDAGTVTISGGTVTATGGESTGAGIGGGGCYFSYSGGAGGTVAISGGTVFAQGNGDGADIGPGGDGANIGTTTFTGGSIRLGGSFASPAPSNGTEQVFCAVVTGFDPNEPVTLTAPAGYGGNDIAADDGGAIYLWLPNGEHGFTANGGDETVKIQDGVGPTGVTVNGEEVAFPTVPPADWSYDAETRILTLSGEGPFTLSGVNGAGGVCVVVPEGVTNAVELSNLTLKALGGTLCAFALETNANVSLTLAGANTLASGSGRAGLEVVAGRTLAITNAPGDEVSALTATGGYGGAGIGGGGTWDAVDAGGTMTINGGIVTAVGGMKYAPGIGGGAGVGTVTVNGGIVTAVGARYGAGIGTSGYVTDDSGYGGTVTINGGTVTATGGVAGAGIGGGCDPYDSGDPGGMVFVHGGRVTATGGDYAPGIGGGSSPWGDGGEGATLAVSGGTVLATGGAGGGPAIGGGIGDLEDGGTTPNVSGTSTFTGGSIRIDGGYAAAAPSNGAERVWCVTVPNLTPNAPVEIALPAESLPATFGVNDLVADAAGKLYLWLPDGSYAFTADGAAYTATVANAPTTATQGSSGGPAAPVFATDGSGFAFDGTSFSIKITNAQSGIWYSLYAADTLGGTWEIVESVCAENDGDLVFDNLDATAPSRFFKVEASATQP
jgi:hypothetical protein